MLENISRLLKQTPHWNQSVDHEWAEHFFSHHLNLYNAAILLHVIIFVIPRISLLFPYHAQITIITKIVSATAVRGRLTGDFCN